MATKKKVTTKKSAAKKPAVDVLRNYMDIELTSLVEADWNYKEDDADLQRSLEEQIRRNGQIENIIVRKVSGGVWEVVNGNHRVRAFRNLGYETALCYNLGEISLEHAKRIAVETNETRFASDRVKLAQRIAELTEKFSTADLSATMPYSEQEIDNTRQILSFDWTDKSKRVRCPACKQEFKAK